MRLRLPWRAAGWRRAGSFEACLFALLPGLLGLAAAQAAASPDTGVRALGRVETRYLLRCGGCHGTQGRSPETNVPSLSGQVGWFLCTAEGRSYLLRLPNVTRAPLSDAELAELMNWVVFRLGGASVPANAQPFTAEEVQAARARPLLSTTLVADRQAIVSSLMQRCSAPASLAAYGRNRGGGDAVLRVR